MKESFTKAATKTSPNACPCGNETYTTCCKPYHTGKTFPDTAEKLMRSRYSAYALSEVEYLYNTTHPSERHADLKDAIAQWAQEATFLQLIIKKTEAGKKNDKRGIVEFVATYSEADKIQQRQEESLFEKVKKRWYYVGAA